MVLLVFVHIKVKEVYVTTEAFKNVINSVMNFI